MVNVKTRVATVTIVVSTSIKLTSSQRIVLQYTISSIKLPHCTMSKENTQA